MAAAQNQASAQAYFSWARWPRAIKRIARVHAFLYRASFGLLGGNAGGMPTLLLTTRGRKSGAPRTTPLPYFKYGGGDGDGGATQLAVVASFGGAARNPSWAANIAAHPQVQVQLRFRRRQNAAARAATSAERRRLWRAITEAEPRFLQYQAATAREIPVFVITPAADSLTSAAPTKGDAMASNGQWRLKTRPQGMVTPANFEYAEEQIPQPAEGEVLVRNLYLAFEPAMRGWLNATRSYVPPVGIGEVMRAQSVGQVAESRHADFAAGDFVTGMLGWQQYALAAPGAGASAATAQGLRKTPPGVDPMLALSVLGITGLTAYFGMQDVGAVKEGDAVLVSGAAGATGSIAAQIARLRGAAKVVGIAGGPQKCEWLKREAGLDAALDYKAEPDLRAALQREFPKGVDLFFDNVGGEILDAALLNMALHGRVVICGGISQYNAEEVPPGPRNYMQIVLRRLTVRGFILFDFAKRSEEATRQLVQWLNEGKLAHAEDVQHGFENTPQTFLRLFSGANLGKQLLQIAEPQGQG